MQTILTISDFIQANILVIGFILIAPACYRLIYGTVIWIASKFLAKKDIVIRHFHNGKLVSVTTIKAELGKPLIIKPAQGVDGD